MSVRRALMLVASGLTALALIVGAGFFYATHRVSKSSAVPEISASDRLKFVLVPAEMQPQGTQMREMGMQDEGAAQAFDIPPGFTFTPAACLQYLNDAIGNPAQFPGFAQFGVRPPDAKGKPGQFSAFALSVPGGVDLDNLQAKADACGSGRMTMPSLQVGASVKLGTYTPPTLAGARTIGITITTAFDASTTPASRAAALGQCSVPNEPDQPDKIVSVMALAKACATAAKTEMATSTTDVRYVTYVSYGDLLIAACLANAESTNEMATTMFQRAQQAMGA